MLYVTNAQIGDGTNEHFIAYLGVRNFDLCIVAIGDEFLSTLEATSLLKEHRAKFVVARVQAVTHMSNFCCVMVQMMLSILKNKWHLGQLCDTHHKHVF